MPSDQPPIEPSTKVAAFLDHYPELEDVLIGLAPPFKKLRNPFLRKSVAKVASLRQAAAVARLPVEEVVNALRAAAGQAPLVVGDSEEAPDYLGPRPDWFDPERVVASVDEQTSGSEDEMTLNLVARGAKHLQGGEILELVTTFIPAPGIDIMRKKGFLVWSTEEDSGVVRTYLTRPVEP